MSKFVLEGHKSILSRKNVLDLTKINKKAELLKREIITLLILMLLTT